MPSIKRLRSMREVELILNLPIPGQHENILLTPNSSGEREIVGEVTYDFKKRKIEYKEFDDYDRK